MKNAIKKYRELLCAGAFVLVCAITAAVFAVLFGAEADPLSMTTWDGHGAGFLLVCGMFLLETALGRADRSLLLPAAAEALTAVGFMTGPERGVSALWLPLGVCLLTAAFLYLNRRRSCLRYFGIISLVCGAVLGAWFLLSLLLRGRFAPAVEAAVAGALRGDPGVLPLCLSRYLSSACGCAAACDMVSRLRRRAGEAQALATRSKLLSDNCHILEQSVRDTSAMRHEWKNNILALQLIAQKGDLDRLRAMLSRLGDRLGQLSPRQFTQNFTVNTILRSAAYQAQQRGIRFEASADLPAELHIGDDALCSFLLNMLDNALLEASEAPAGQRSVEIDLKLSHGYLAILCENTFAGTPADDGQLPSAGPGHNGADSGLAQMRLIAKRCGGMLDIAHTGQRITVNAALRDVPTP